MKQIDEHPLKKFLIELELVKTNYSAHDKSTYTDISTDRPTDQTIKNFEIRETISFQIAKVILFLRIYILLIYFYLLFFLTAHSRSYPKIKESAYLKKHPKRNLYIKLYTYSE